MAAVRQPAGRLSHLDFIVLSLYWVAIGYLWQSLATLILPDMVQSLVGHEHKGVALSTLEGIGTIMAVVWQPLAGSISDRTRTPAAAAATWQRASAASIPASLCRFRAR